MFCRKGFTEETDMIIHEKEVHEIQCKFCDSMFYTDDEIKKHIEKNHGQKISSKKPKPELDCDYYPYLTRNSLELMTHMKGHSSKFMCNKCDFTSNSQAAFKVHIQANHTNHKKKYSSPAYLVK